MAASSCCRGMSASISATMRPFGSRSHCKSCPRKGNCKHSAMKASSSLWIRSAIEFTLSSCGRPAPRPGNAGDGFILGSSPGSRHGAYQLQGRVAVILVDGNGRVCVRPHVSQGSRQNFTTSWACPNAAASSTPILTTARLDPLIEAARPEGVFQLAVRPLYATRRTFGLRCTGSP